LDDVKFLSFVIKIPANFDLATCAKLRQVLAMGNLQFKSKIEQVADYLRENIFRGRWGQNIPGRNELAKELGVNGKTVEEALRYLEHEGLLTSQGAGRRRRIARPDHIKGNSLRVAVLNYEPDTRGENYIIDLVHQLADAGHMVTSPQKTLLELGMNVNRIAKLVVETQADAWVVVGGSRLVLEWFAAQPFPVFAVFGRRRGLPIAGAGPDKPPAVKIMTERLLELGHWRIAMLVRAERRQPKPGATERAFLEAMKARGIEPSSFHLPEWEESAIGFQKRLEDLFRVTPPTALIVDETPFFTATMQFCTKRGIRVPEDLSIACCDHDPAFSWCAPPISHIQWESRVITRRAVSWASNVSRGRTDNRQSESKAKFVEGGTIGPAPKQRANAGQQPLGSHSGDPVVV
jgi:DNA-binding LacI/PurR family transcriptional regulator